MKVYLIFAPLVLLIACKKPILTDISTYGRMINTANNSPLDTFSFQLKYLRAASTGYGYHDQHMVKTFFTDAQGYFHADFEITEGSTYGILYTKDSVLNMGSKNGDLGTIYLIP